MSWCCKKKGKAQRRNMVAVALVEDVILLLLKVEMRP